MNIIERYISAYVLHCLFPEQTASATHLGYIYEVLRESRSTPQNELLRQVLDFTRQSDPADKDTQRTVAAYVASRLMNEKPVEPEYVAKFAGDEIAQVFTVMKGGKPIAFAGCLTSSIDECIKELQSQFPGIEIRPY